MGYTKWAETVGASALYHWLLGRDISWFDPAAWAIPTPWKEVVKEAGMQPIESWVRDLWQSPDDTLGLPGVGKALWTSKELCILYYGLSDTDISPNQIKAMANGLRNQGFTQANEGKLIRRGDGSQADRFWVIRHRDRSWDLNQCVAHFRSHK